jgi:hypothetical protein
MISWHQAVRYGLHLAVLILLLQGFKPVELRQTTTMVESLLSGSHKAYTPLGAEIEPYRKILPQKGIIAFVMDGPLRGDKLVSEKEHGFQNYLCPLILDTEARENAGMIYCSNDEIAEKRIAELGFRWLEKLGDGKGIIVRSKP